MPTGRIWSVRLPKGANKLSAIAASYVDVYNSLNKDQPPVQVILDFQDDVAEREQIIRMKKAA